jgi:hypothetical protein
MANRWQVPCDSWVIWGKQERKIRMKIKIRKKSKSKSQSKSRITTLTALQPLVS